jgi:hypothetical protein
MVEESGLQELFWGAPMVLLTAAQHRYTGPDRQEDRIYGIMQVFGFQLGKSAPGVDPHRHFKLPELEDQLGAALLEKYPVMSQLHIHNLPPTPGKGWRIGSHSSIPNIWRFMYYEMRMNGTMESYSDLTTDEVNGTVFGRFFGFVSSIQALQQTWFCQYAFLPKPHFHAPFMQIDLDNIDWIGSKVPVCDWAQQHLLTEWLAVSCPGMMVLQLGHFSEEEWPRTTNPQVPPKPKRALGLFLAPEEVQKGIKYWRRVGICLWILDDLECEIVERHYESKDSFVGLHGEKWSYLDGLFG